MIGFSPMGRKRVLAVFLFIGAGALGIAQQPAASAGTPAPASAASAGAAAPAPAGPAVSPSEAKALVAEIGASYYHPDALGSIDCGVVFDWKSLAQQLGTPDAGDRMKALEGMTVQAHAVRGQATKVEIAWPHGASPNQETMENGVKQMVEGFFQTYWKLVATSMTPDSSEKVMVEAGKDGGDTLRFSDHGSTMTEEVDSDHVPTKLFAETPAVKSTIEPHFSPSPNPENGDIRRLTSMDVLTEFGASSMKAHMTMDYQAVEEFDIPRHVSFGLAGAFAVPMELTNCSVAKQVKSGS